MTFYRVKQIASSAHDACVLAGVQPIPEDQIKTTWTSVPVVGKSSRNKAGRIKWFAVGEGGMVFNWIDGIVSYWFNDFDQALTPQQRGAITRKMNRWREEEEAKILERQLFAQTLALDIWNASTECAGHPYLAKKHIDCVRLNLRCIDSVVLHRIVNQHKPYADDGEYQKFHEAGSYLVIPMTDCEGTIHSVQLINRKGTKIFLKCSRKKGLFWSNHPHDVLAASEQIGIAEGIATAVSVELLAQAKGKDIKCVAAFDAGNLHTVAQALFNGYTEVPRIDLYADNDASGIGKSKADYAYRWLNAFRCKSTVYMAEFTDEERKRFADLHDGNQPTDWNDFMILRGAQ